jgi:hypothetical protein
MGDMVRTIFRRLKRIAMVLVAMITLMVLSVVAVSFYEKWRFADHYPPAGMRTVSEFLQWHPRPGDSYRVTLDGVVYFVVKGRRLRWLASGPSLYVFDRAGNFVGWSRDQGDDFNPPVVFRSDAVWESVPLSTLSGSK